MNARVRILVEGRVQGVGFRYECRRLAVRLGLRGWVKNRDDGGVEIVAEGGQEALDRLSAWSRKGPPGAWVTACHAAAEPPAGEFDSFEVRF